MNAICYKCGAEKPAPFVACSTCGSEPRTDEELTLSFSVCNNYVDQEMLSQLGPYIQKHGHPPILPDFVMEDLQEEALVFHGMQAELKDAWSVDQAAGLFRKGEYEEAHQILLDVVQRVPNPCRTKTEGVLHTYIKFWDDESFQHYMQWHERFGHLPAKSIVRLPNAYPRAYHWLALVDMENNDYQQAVKDLLKGRELEPTCSILDYLLGLAYPNLGEPEKALDAVNRIAGISEYIDKKQYAEALMMKARILAEMRRFDEAMAAYRKSLPFGPSKQEARMFPAHIALMMSDKNKE